VTGSAGAIAVHSTLRLALVLRKARLQIVICLPILICCASCADPNETRIRDACEHAAENGMAPHQADTAQRCSCIAASAKRYLDKEDYALLAKVSAIYTSDDDQETKVHGMINTLVDAGVSPSRAALIAMDFMFLAHKVDAECATQVNGRTN